MPRALDQKSKEMVLSLVHYFEMERDNGGSILPLNAVPDRVCAALNISLSTVNTIVAKFNKGEPLESLQLQKPRSKPVVGIDDCDKFAIRNVIYEMYRNKEHFTLRTLRETLLERQLFNGSMTSLWRLIVDMGFKYSKDNPRRGLMELPHIALKYIEFLQKYIKIKSEGLFQFVFLDETWIFKDGVIGRSWQDSSVRSVKKTKVGGARYIVLHAGCSNGFIPGAELVFASKTLSMDYHGEMNQENFLCWFEKGLLKNLPEPSVIVMDNAPYHSTLVNKAPTSASKKADIQKWLTDNNIAFEHTMFKVQLLNLVKINKPPPVYVAETMAQKYGHTVLRLPPYHCMFNPIENIWGIAKNYYRNHVGNEGSSSEHALNTWKKALAEVTPEIWQQTVLHTEREIQKWWDREVMFERSEVSQLIISTADDSSDDSCED